jgi:hypothetical protein
MELNVSKKTLRRALYSEGIFRRKAAAKPYIDESLAALRVKYAREMSAKYPEPKDWHRVRFSDEAHFGY